MITTENLNFVIALLALVISIIAIWKQVQYADMEYKFKFAPEIEPKGNMDFQIQKNDNGKGYRVTSGFKDLEFQILQKNNLRAAYLIHADNKVEKLESSDIEDKLNTEIGYGNNSGEPDIINGEISYYYKFLLKELDGGYELHLLYIKAKNDIVTFKQVSGIEVWELEKAHLDDKGYDGEKQMAKQYKEILEGCEKYTLP